MKKLLIASAALVAAYAVPAMAADMAVKVAPRPVVPACAQFGGGYLGVHGGGLVHEWNWADNYAWARNEVSNTLPDGAHSTQSGYEVGVRAGYDWQRGCTVFGVLADWSWTNTSSSRYFTDGQGGLAVDQLLVRGKLDWYGTVRARTGIVVDSLLLYTTGGFAYARSGWTASVTDILNNVAVTETFANRQYEWGGVIGVGTEWAWTSNWTVTSEFLYMRFANKESTFNSVLALNNGNPIAKPFTFQDQVLVARIGLNYRFSNPVVAKY